MKQGCALMLLIWAGMALFYRQALQGTADAEKWWVWVLLGLSVALVAAQIWSIWLSFRKLRASKRPPESWRDGDLVAVTGRIQALKSVGASPISGKPALMVEYSLKRTVRSNDSSQQVSDYTGFLMVPCGVQTSRGMVRLHGFPLLTSFPEESYDEAVDYSGIAAHLSSATLKEMPSNPLTALKELMAVLNDEDGDLRVDFVHKGAAVRPDQGIDDIFEEGADAPDEESLEGTPSETPATYDPKANFLRRLTNEGYYLKEQLVAPGTEVTAFGTYRANQRAVDVGGGIQNLNHTIEPGALETVMRKNLIKAFIFVVIWSGVAVAGHLYVFPEYRRHFESSGT